MAPIAPTRARKRMNKLISHLTAHDVPSSTSESTPKRHELRRELASAQRERVLNEYGYDLDVDQVIEPVVQYASDVEEEELPRKRSKREYETPQVRTWSRFDDGLEQARSKLAKACQLAHKLGVAGNHAMDDAASAFVPGHGYLVKPLGIRFDEVTEDALTLVTKFEDIPKLHADLYTAALTMNSNQVRCVFSASNENCEMVSITKEGLMALCQDALRVYSRVRRVDEFNLGIRASRANHRHVTCWLVKNRGIVCSGESVEMALADLVFCIRACSFQVRALGAVGGDLKRLDLPTESDVIKSRADMEQRCNDKQAANMLFGKFALL